MNATNCTTFYRDADNASSYGDPTITECWCSAGGTTGDLTQRMTMIVSDGNAQANPLMQTAWFDTHRGDGSYDYNCDGNETQQDTTIGDCACWLYGGSTDGMELKQLVELRVIIPLDADSCSLGCVGFCCNPGGDSYDTRAVLSLASVSIL